jgi:predicted ATP-dependent endonuclease of OLD family
VELISFRIYNYRSIIDTEWCELSSDNITGIIGQNESGKTSILEALYSFYTGEITEDIMRSDLSNPKVSCTFEIQPEIFEEVLKRKNLPEGILNFIRTSHSFTLTRSWDDNMENVIFLDGVEISGFYSRYEQNIREIEAEMQKRIDEYLTKRDQIVDDAENAEKKLREEAKNLESVNNLLSEAKKEFKLLKKTPNGKYAEEKLEEANKLFEETRRVCEIADQEFDVKRRKADEALYHARIVDESVKATRLFNNLQKNLEESFLALHEIQKAFDKTTNEKERRSLQNEMEHLNKGYIQISLEYKEAKKNAVIKKHIAYKFISGKSLALAEKEVMKEKPEVEKFFTKEEAGEILYDLIPEFIFFEDFSSLLPNRIDLEDIMKVEVHKEGLRAARNYLLLSGLTPDFFTETNSRILKQKIEKLNKEVTLDFHDFWKQNVGKENKISINFELEHYDDSDPEKVGHPYLEFWIKDKYDRLYPKQRSRGVRWFLSFYLELKASSLSKDEKGRVLLIDEPGLSLHARAQEDVLKVFEHIKDKMQIIYSTHSAHLIDIRKLHRLLAVQRAIENDESSETKVYNARSLAFASADTLTPVYTLIGSSLNEQQFIHKNNNVIIEDITTYYYLTVFRSLIGFKKEIYFLPASKISNITTMVNILLGWGLDFIVLTGNSSEGRKTHAALKNTLYLNDDKASQEHLVHLDNFYTIEDLFSTLDFKKFILHKRIGIPESNSEYIEENNILRPVLASGFMDYVEENEIKFDSFDEETRENFEHLFQMLDRGLR